MTRNDPPEPQPSAAGARPGPHPAPARWRRWEGPALAGILLAAVAVRWVAIAWAQTFASDGVYYLQMARQFTERPFSEVCNSYPYHPLYSLLVAGLAELTGADWPDGWLLCARLVSAGASLVLLLGVWALGRLAMGPVAAAISTLLLALAGPVTEASTETISDPTAIALAVAAGVLALLARRSLLNGQTRCLALAAGAAAAAALGYLTRPEELLLGALGLGLLAWPGGVQRRRLHVAAVVLFLAVLAGGVLPYANVIGGLTQKKGVEDFVHLGGRADPLALVGMLGVNGVRLWEAFSRVITRATNALGVPLMPLLYTWAGLVVFRHLPFLGIPRAVRLLPRWPGALMVFGPAVVMVPLLMSLNYQMDEKYISSRHMLMPCAFLMPLCGAALVGLAEWTLESAGRRGWPKIPWLSYTGWLAGMLAAACFQLLPVAHEHKGSYRQAGRYIRETYGPDLPIITSDLRIAFHAAAPAEQFSYRTQASYHLHAGEAANRRAFWRALEVGRRGQQPVILALTSRFNQRNRHYDMRRWVPEDYTLVRTFGGTGEEETVWVYRKSARQNGD